MSAPEDEHTVLDLSEAPVDEEAATHIRVPDLTGGADDPTDAVGDGAHGNDGSATVVSVDPAGARAGRGEARLGDPNAGASSGTDTHIVDLAEIDSPTELTDLGDGLGDGLGDRDGDRDGDGVGGGVGVGVGDGVGGGHGHGHGHGHGVVVGGGDRHGPGVGDGDEDGGPTLGVGRARGLLGPRLIVPGALVVGALLIAATLLLLPANDAPAPQPEAPEPVAPLAIDEPAGTVYATAPGDLSATATLERQAADLLAVGKLGEAIGLYEALLEAKPERREIALTVAALRRQQESGGAR